MAIASCRAEGVFLPSSCSLGREAGPASEFYGFEGKGVDAGLVAMFRAAGDEGQVAGGAACGVFLEDFEIDHPGGDALSDLIVVWNVDEGDVAIPIGP